MHYDPPSSDGTNEVSASGSGNNGGSVTLTGLSPSTSYSIKVAAESDLGRGPFSDPITEVTDSELFTLCYRVVATTTNQYIPACMFF